MCFVSPSLGGEGTNRFVCVSPVYISILIGVILICVPGFFWTSRRILTKLMCVNTIKSWLHLYDLELLFRVTLEHKLPNLSKIMIVSAKSPKPVNELWMHLYERILARKGTFHKVTKWRKLQNLSEESTVKDCLCYICWSRVMTETILTGIQL